MKLEIRKLAPGMAEDYVRFFDETPHYHGVAEQKCYCVCFAGADSESVDFSTAEKRRALAAEYVRDGALQGYLAAVDGRIVGWCNANERGNCVKCLSWRMFMQKVPLDGARVKSVFCFAVAPEMQRKGVATALLERVCEDAKAEGYDFVEVYPNRTFVDTAEEFHGPLEMYRRSGFEVAEEIDGMLVMRKSLR